MFRLRVFANFFFLLVLCILMSSALGIESDEALAAVERADSAVASAYQAVLEAEEAGANVSSLLDDLNLGVETLAKANMLYRIGDFDGAVYLADLCYDSVEGVAAEAYGLKCLAVFDRKDRLILTSLVSTVGVSYAVFGSFLGWRVLKRRYRQRVLKMRPEVMKE